MSSKKQEGPITPGRQYFLDAKEIVTVIRPINRAKTTFSIEIPGRGIEIVEGSRLKEAVLS
jgi:hypothetical protein